MLVGGEPAASAAARAGSGGGHRTGAAGGTHFLQAVKQALRKGGRAAETGRSGGKGLPVKGSGDSRHRAAGPDSVALAALLQQMGDTKSAGRVVRPAGANATATLRRSGGKPGAAGTGDGRGAASKIGHPSTRTSPGALDLLALDHAIVRRLEMSRRGTAGAVRDRGAGKAGQVGTGVEALHRKSGDGIGKESLAALLRQTERHPQPNPQAAPTVGKESAAPSLPGIPPAPRVPGANTGRGNEVDQARAHRVPGTPEPLRRLARSLAAAAGHARDAGKTGSSGGAAAAADAFLARFKDAVHRSGSNGGSDGGLSGAAPGASLAAAPPNQMNLPAAAPGGRLSPHAGAQHFGDLLGKHVGLMLNQGSQSAVLHLDPPQLGSLQIHLNAQQNNVSAWFISPHADVRQALEAGMPALRQALAQQGVSLAGSFVADQGRQQQFGDRSGGRSFASAGILGGGRAQVAGRQESGPAVARTPRGLSIYV